MKNKRTIIILVLCIIALSLFASGYGLFSKGGPGAYEFKSLHGQTVTIYGKGLYMNDSVSAAVQELGQDMVTLCLGIPLLILSLYLFNKGLLRGRLLLTGTIGYFLYTYTSYSFLSMYNPLFLVYAALMSMSLYAFILSMMSFDIANISSYFNEKMNVKLLGGVLIFFASAIGLMWLKLITLPLIHGAAPSELEQYTTLVIQAMDLGFVVPATLLSGVLLIRKRPFGYLLSSVMIIKGITMLTATTAMVIMQVLAGVSVPPAVAIIFTAFNLVVILCLVHLMKNVNEPAGAVVVKKASTRF